LRMAPADGRPFCMKEHAASGMFDPQPPLPRHPREGAKQSSGGIRQAVQ
jgi:hypothetical protein